MPTDPIRAALEVAAMEICPMQGCSGYTPACGDCNPQAAAAIAAFLEALAKARPVRLPEDYGLMLPYIPAALAAAVRRAAKGGSDGG